MLIILLCLLRLISANINNLSSISLFPTLPNAVLYTQNQLCEDHSTLYLKHLENFTYWAYEMWDASAKSASGLLRRNKYQFGHWKQCMTVNGPFKTRYCLATLSVTVPKPKRDLLSIDYQPYENVFHRLYKGEDLSQLDRNMIQVAFCIPASCSPKNLQTALKKYITDLKLDVFKNNVNYSVQISEELCHSQEEIKMFGFADKTFCLLSVALIIMVIFATVYDFKKVDARKKTVGCINIICDAFSARKNFQDLFIADSNSALHILYGLKVLTMLIMIIYHRYVLRFGGPLLHYDDIEMTYRNKSINWLTNRVDIFVEVFFSSSALLMTYFTLIQLDKRPLFPKFEILTRYLRLTPVFAFVVFFSATIFNHIGSGPLWKAAVTAEVEACQSNWWIDMLYLQNYFYDDNICLMHSWYLACEFHFYVIGLTLTLLLSKNKCLGFLTIAAALLLAIIAPFFVITNNSLLPVMPIIEGLLPSVKKHKYTRLMFTKSHMRASSYIIGIVAGYIYYRLRGSSKKIRKITSYCLSTLSLAIMVGTMKLGSIFYDPYYQYDEVAAGIFGALNRPVWTIGLLGLLFTASYGHSNILNAFLSWEFWIPLSKLNYSAYLIHMLWQIASIGAETIPKRLDDFYIFFESLGDVLFAYILAMPIYLAIECPTRKLVRELLIVNKTIKNSSSTVATDKENNKEHQH